MPLRARSVDCSGGPKIAGQAFCRIVSCSRADVLVSRHVFRLLHYKYCVSSLLAVAIGCLRLNRMTTKLILLGDALDLVVCWQCLANVRLSVGTGRRRITSLYKYGLSYLYHDSSIILNLVFSSHIWNIPANNLLNIA